MNAMSYVRWTFITLYLIVTICSGFLYQAWTADLIPMALIIVFTMGFVVVLASIMVKTAKPGELYND